MNIAIVLVHNKGDLVNKAQIDRFLPLIVQITDTHQIIEQNQVVGSYNTFHYQISNLNIPHQVKFFQIIPFGVTLPDNLYSLDSFKVFYGQGDEDKIGDHPRFFNYGMRFPFDSMGAEIVILIQNHLLFNLPVLTAQLSLVKEQTILLDHPSFKIGTKKLITEHPEIAENDTLSNLYPIYLSKIQLLGS